MAVSAEVLIPENANVTGKGILGALADSASGAGVDAVVTKEYRGGADWLVMWGIGGDDRSRIRDKHVADGGYAALWDIGFFKREKVRGYCKVSINQDYATAWLDRTAPEPDRWDCVGLTLRDDADKDGPIILAGVGPKQRMYMGMSSGHDCWEAKQLERLRQRFPGRRIIYRPKPQRPFPALRCETDGASTIEALLKGASLVVCMHSNVAVDAVVAGVPFESEDGVSTWLRGKPYTREVRLDFVRRISRWQYKAVEMVDAWRFMRGIVAF